MSKVKQFTKELVFSRTAQIALAEARPEAAQRKQNYIGAVHLLLGLLKQKDAESVALFGKLGINAEAMYASVAQDLGNSRNGKYKHGSKRFEHEDIYTDRLRKVIGWADTAMRVQKKSEIEPIHLILGMATVGKGVAAENLIKSGVTEDKCHEILARI